MKTIHARIEGKVQGVFFRDFTKRQADSFGLKGWVKNMTDGSVEATISGEEKSITGMISWLHNGSPYSSVSRVITTEIHPSLDFPDFRITF